MTAPDGQPLDRFGSSVTVIADTAVVGAPHGDGFAPGGGAVYVYRWNGSAWTLASKLAAADGAAGDLFGFSVVLRGESLLVGAPGSDSLSVDSGAAYVFDRQPGGAFRPAAKLVAPNGAAGDAFGTFVAMEDDVAMLGAPGCDRRAADAGAAYVFERSPTDGGWSATAELLAADGRAGDAFGCAGDIEDIALVGAKYADARGTDSGAVYVFERTGGAWPEIGKVTPSDGAAFDHFGASVSVCPEYSAVGAPHADGVEPDAGAAYLLVFLHVGRVIEADKLVSETGHAGDRFGYSVAVRGYRAIVGAPLADAGSGRIGAATAYNLKGYRRDGILLTASDGSPGDWFGSSVAIGADTSMIGAHRDDALGEGAGSAYLYSGIEAFESRAGNVNARLGPVTDVLFVNGSAGSEGGRRLVLDADAPFELRIDGPPSIPSGARYVVFAWMGEASLLACEALPRGTGHMGMPTPISGRAPQPAFVANAWGFESALGRDNWPGPPVGRAPFVLASRARGLRRAGDFYLQGLIRDAAAPNGIAAVTNGVAVEVR